MFSTYTKVKCRFPLKLHSISDPFLSSNLFIKYTIWVWYVGYSFSSLQMDLEWNCLWMERKATSIRQRRQLKIIFCHDFVLVLILLWVIFALSLCCSQRGRISVYMVVNESFSILFSVCLLHFFPRPFRLKWFSGMLLTFLFCFGEWLYIKRTFVFRLVRPSRLGILYKCYCIWKYNLFVLYYYIWWFENTRVVIVIKFHLYRIDMYDFCFDLVEVHYQHRLLIFSAVPTESLINQFFVFCKIDKLTEMKSFVIINFNLIINTSFT